MHWTQRSTTCVQLTTSLLLQLLLPVLLQLSVSAGNGWPHNALRHHWLMPISCHFRDCKALLVTSLTHVSGAVASVQTFTFTFTTTDIGESNPVTASGYNPDWAQKLISSSMSRHLSTSNISSKSIHAFLINLANRQTDRQTYRQTRVKAFTSSVVRGR